MRINVFQFGEIIISGGAKGPKPPNFHQAPQFSSTISEQF